MNISVKIFVLAALMFCFLLPNVSADGGHGAEVSQKPRKIFSPVPSSSERDEDRSVKGELLDKFFVDGFEVRVKIADVRDSVSDGGSHNVLVKLKLGNDIQRNFIVKTQVTFPGNTRKTKTNLELGDWYLAGFDLELQGRHQIKITFKGNEEKNHSVEVIYP